MSRLLLPSVLDTNRVFHGCLGAGRIIADAKDLPAGCIQSDSMFAGVRPLVVR